jgi:hypothetical protein
MDTMSAFARGQAAKGQLQRVFDWVKAAEIIKERQPTEASAGLAEDLGWTSGPIWVDGKPVKREDTYVYLSSNWAVPVLIIDGHEIECWKYEKDTPEWNSGTYWPPEACVVLGVEVR